VCSVFLYCFFSCVFCVFVLFLLLHVVVSFRFVCLLTNHCHQMATQLQLTNTVYHMIPRLGCSLNLSVDTLRVTTRPDDEPHKMTKANDANKATATMT
jgi:hypothetical protein